MPLSTILKTKFYPPQPTSDFVERNHLLARFEALKQKSVMLVSASTGYGKSTVVADYLSHCNQSFVWLSLSDKENDFKRFVTYFIHAIQIEIPDFGTDVLELINAPAEVPMEDISELTQNCFAKLVAPLYFALDDYHLIRNDSVHHFLTTLFDYSQPFIKLIIITRRNPGLPIYEWMTKNILVEIRSSDLRFNRTEIASFYDKSIGYSPEDDILDKLQEITSGWISGLRMLSLSVDTKENLHDTFLHLQGQRVRVLEELIRGVLKKQTDSVQKQLLKLSIIKEFDIDLFSAICLNSEQQENKEVHFSTFISSITRSNLFIISLDDKHQWYRFHHMFLEHMYAIFTESVDEDQLNMIKVSAAKVYEDKTEYEEAISLYLESDHTHEALLAFYILRRKLVSTSRFYILEKVFQLFPSAIRENYLEMQLTQAWLYMYKGKIVKMGALGEKMYGQLKLSNDKSEDTQLLLGEVSSVLAYYHYLSKIDMGACLKHAKIAIELCRNKNDYAYGLGWIFYGGAMQILRNVDKAKKALFNELSDCEHVDIKAQLLLVLWFIQWFEAEFEAAVRTANLMLELGLKFKHKMSINHGYIMKGMAQMCMYENEQATQNLKSSVPLRHYGLHPVSFPPILLLNKLLAENDLNDELRSNLKLCHEFVMNEGGQRFKKELDAVEAELSFGLMENRNGLNWAKQHDFMQYLPLNSLFSAEIVQAKLLVSDNESNSHEKAEAILSELTPFFEKRNNLNNLVGCYLAKAVLKFKQKDENKSSTFLEKALEITYSRKYIRPYVEYGDVMHEMLKQRSTEKKFREHITEILRHFKDKIVVVKKVFLSKREKEVLLMAESFTNKEVGNKLFIAEKTVKTHLTNINKKLQAGSKIEAIEKARSYNLL